MILVLVMVVGLFVEQVSVCDVEAIDGYACRYTEEIENVSHIFIDFEFRNVQCRTEAVPYIPPVCAEPYRQGR